MKKILSAIAIVLSLIIVFSSATLGSVGAAVTLGDANKDGNFNHIDALWMRKMLVKEVAKNTYADVNENSIIDSDDVRQTVRVLAEVQKNFTKWGEVVTTPSKTTAKPAWQPPADNGSGGAAPFYEGGVPMNYYNKLASACVSSGYISDGLNRDYHTVAVNQVGYSTGVKKIAKLVEGRDSNTVSNVDRVNVYLVEETTKTVKATFRTGKKVAFLEKLGGEDYVWYSDIDFSSFNEPGTYRFYTPVGYSHPFVISDNPYGKVNDDILMGLYYQRCGGPIEASVLQKYDQYLVDTYGATPGEYYDKYDAYIREACHLVSKGSNAGKEVVVVDDYKKLTSIKYKYTLKPTGIETKVQSAHPIADSMFYASYSTSNDISYVTLKIYAETVLTDAQVDAIKATIESEYSKNGLVFQSKSTGDAFVADTDSNGNVIKLPATDFGLGLHDAGDYGRYCQPAAQVVADLVQIYELAPEAFTLDMIQDTNGLGQPDDLPDILDHARWEAKFLLNMQNKNKNSESYGGFYFKICTGTFASAQGARPENDYAFNGTKSGDHGGFRVNNVNFATTAGCAGALASCARVFKDLDPAFAEECRVAAELAYDFYNNNRTSSPRNMSIAEKQARDQAPAEKDAPEWQVGGGAYGGRPSEADSSQFYMYAALYRLNGSTTLHSKLKAATPGTSMSTQAHGGFGTMTYILTAKYKEQEIDETLYNKCVNAFVSSANSNIDSTSKTEFGNLNKNYGWGSNAIWAGSLRTNAACMILGLSDSDHTSTLRSNISYMLGTNPEGWCFVTGLTSASSKNIHHFPSQLLKNKTTPVAPGLIAAGYSKDSSSYTESDKGKFRYRDDSADYVTNEICVYWNSAVLYAYSAIFREDLLKAN